MAPPRQPRASDRGADSEVKAGVVGCTCPGHAALTFQRGPAPSMVLPALSPHQGPDEQEHLDNRAVHERDRLITGVQGAAATGRAGVDPAHRTGDLPNCNKRSTGCEGADDAIIGPGGTAVAENGIDELSPHRLRFHDQRVALRTVPYYPSIRPHKLSHTGQSRPCWRLRDCKLANTTSAYTLNVVTLSGIMHQQRIRPR
jgi:hypothetical protein